MNTPHVLTHLDIRGTRFRNRIWVAPMCQFSCMEQDGIPTDWHLVHLGRFSAGGAGLVMAEATGVSPEGRITAQCPGLWNDEQAKAWARVVDFLHAQGATAGIQLAHAGRKASTHWPHGPQVGHTLPAAEGGWRTAAPSALAYPGLDEPEALTVAQIDGVVADFASSAARADRAGFDVVEIHAAHGYVLHEFLSPLTNQRIDAYGGSLENRARILVRIVAAVRQAMGDKPVFVRFSATDWLNGGWTPEETSAVAMWCQDAGADLFDISSGGGCSLHRSRSARDTRSR